ncbi:MAG: type IV pilin [Methanosarcinaceae archaeon]|nr:type IV pilin [Methanosarcinaceae archaeon]
MNFKLFLKNKKAVSPVIGVVLMVAITVILAAAIGSSVFGKGTSNPAPQANLKLTANGIDTYNNGTVLIEHLGGDPINFTSSSVTKVVAYNGSATSNLEVGELKTLDVGATKTFTVEAVNLGDTLNIKIIDVATNQLICDQDLRF